MTSALRVFVVEDEIPAREYLQSLLVSAGISVIGTSGNSTDAIARINTSHPDVVFLDVNLRDGDGLTVLRELNYSPHVVFTTAYEAHAVAAFELGAVDYLLKPFSPQRLTLAVDRIRRVRIDSGAAADTPSTLDRVTQVAGGSRPLTRLFVRDAGGITPLVTASVVRLEADGDYVRIFTEQKSYLTALTLNAVEAMLDPARFVRIHRSHLVNFDYVVGMRPYDSARLQVVLRDGKRIVASKTRSRDLRQLAF